ncbi:hypothetical protein LCGC14_2429730, partial [marine sediment metagenome]
MKLYYDSDDPYDGDPTWIEVTKIKTYPSIKNRMGAGSTITFVIADFEGALYSTWSALDFV